MAFSPRLYKGYVSIVIDGYMFVNVKFLVSVLFALP